MRIALYDYDLNRRPNKPQLNVELLKLASYYESKGHEIVMINTYDPIFNFDKIIVAISRYPLNIKAREQLSAHPNVEYIGTGANNWNFIPFNNAEINNQPIKTKYYKILINRLKKNNQNSETTIKKLDNLLLTKWVRLYPTNEHIPLKDLLTGEKTNIVDNYLFDKPDWYDTLRELSIYQSYFKFVAPQIIRTQNDFDNFIQIKEMGFQKIKANILINDYDELKDFLIRNKDVMQTYRTNFFFTFFYDKNNFYTENFYLQELVNSVKKLELCQQLDIQISQLLIMDYSNYYLTKELTEAFKEVAVNPYVNVQEAFFRRIKGNVKDLRNYYHLLNSHPYLFEWLRKKKKREWGFEDEREQ